MYQMALVYYNEYACYILETCFKQFDTCFRFEIYI